MDTRERIKAYLDIAWRRKWWVALPLALSVGAGFGLLRYLPKVYRASTTILVIRQSLPEEFAKTTVTERVEERMASLQVQVLSRSYLQTVAEEFHLVPEGATEVQIAGACGRLRRRVSVTYDKARFSSFEIAAVDENPILAAGVANRLARLFIDQNTRYRTKKANETLAQIDRWLEKKQEELQNAEEEVANYRRHHPWELPDQLQTNVNLLQSYQDRLTGIGNEIQSQNQRLDALIEAQAKGDAPAPLPPMPGVSPEARNLRDLQRELSRLLASYTENHPAVRSKREEIAEYIRSHPEAGDTGSEAVSSKPETVLGGQIRELRTQITGLQRQRSDLDRKIQEFQTRIANTPTVQVELEALNRKVEANRGDYNDLVQKKILAERGTDLEESRQGEQFQVQDEARVPTAPFKPQPLQVHLLCLMAGLGLGVGLIVILEFMNPSFRSEDEFRRAFPDLPLLTIVPSLKDSEPKRRVTRGARGPGKHAAMAILASLSQLVGLVRGRWW